MFRTIVFLALLLPLSVVAENFPRPESLQPAVLRRVVREQPDAPDAELHEHLEGVKAQLVVRLGDGHQQRANLNRGHQSLERVERSPPRGERRPIVARNATQHPRGLGEALERHLDPLVGLSVSQQEVLKMTLTADLDAITDKTLNREYQKAKIRFPICSVNCVALG